MNEILKEKEITKNMEQMWLIHNHIERVEKQASDKINELRKETEIVTGINLSKLQKETYILEGGLQRENSKLKSKISSLRIWLLISVFWFCFTTVVAFYGIANIENILESNNIELVETKK